MLLAVQISYHSILNTSLEDKSHDS